MIMLAHDKFWQSWHRNSCWRFSSLCGGFLAIS